MIGIKDFGMPRCCVNCQMCDAYEKGMCVITDTECEDMYSKRNDDCPLVEIIEPDDCVSREAILNELSKWDWQDLYLPIHFKELIIDELPSVQPKRDKGEWIPIKSLKDIPQGKEILVCDCDGLIKIGYAVTYRFKGFDKEDDVRVSDSGGDRIKGIVAYMPLPKPYKADKGDKE